MTKIELKTTLLLAGIYASRMLGLFLIFPTFSLLADGLTNATPLKIGLALSIYSLSQAILQIPAGILSDIIGRKKVLYGGLSLFFIGSLLAAIAQDINGLIVARFLQGAGAVSAVCLAYVADSVRSSEHGKSMAIIGVSIASSFVLSFVIGAMISSAWGLSGLFGFTAMLALLAIVFAILLPQPAQNLIAFRLPEFIQVVKNPLLLQVNLQVACLHLCLSATFFLIPLLLQQHLQTVNVATLYLPPIILAFVLVLPIIRRSRAQITGRLTLFWVGFALALLCLAQSPVFTSSSWFMLALGFFFFTFTFIEAMLPTRLFQIATDTSRGATSGIFSVYQYGGNFLGGLVGAQLYTVFAKNATINLSFYILAAVVALLTIATVAFTKNNITGKKYG